MTVIQVESPEKTLALDAVSRTISVLSQVEDTTFTGVVIGGSVQHGARSAVANTPGVADLGGGRANLGLADGREELAFTGLISIQGAGVQGMEAEPLASEVHVRKLIPSLA